MMTELEAVQKSLLLCGFIYGGQTFFFEDTDKQCYIPMHVVLNFKGVIDYCQAYAFYKHCNKEEKKIYYKTARKLEKLRDKFYSDF